MTRTVLYYPTINIPDGIWLRQAILYFDKVASIIPQTITFAGESIGLHVPLSPELEFLRSENLFKPVAPDILTIDDGHWPAIHQLRDEFEQAVNEQWFRRRLPPNKDQKFVRVHQGKLAYPTMDFLRSKNLLRGDEHHLDWAFVEETTALLYMSMLAQLLADTADESTIPGTDSTEYEAMAYSAPTPDKGFPGIEVRLRDVLPIPRPDIPIADIIAFRTKRKSELLAYRAEIDKIQNELSTAENKREVVQLLTKFKEAQERGLNDLNALLSDSKIAVLWGSAKTLLKANSPTLWGSAAVAVGAAASIAALPLSLMAAGVTLAGVVEVRSYQIDERNKRRVAARASPFAYLHQARAEGVVQRLF